MISAKSVEIGSKIGVQILISGALLRSDFVNEKLLKMRFFAYGDNSRGSVGETAKIIFNKVRSFSTI